jgi:hypothetical protein
MPGCLQVVFWIIGVFVAIAVIATVADRMTGPPPGVVPLVGGESSEAALVQKPRLVDFGWSKGGFGAVMIARFTIANDNDFPIKDIAVACTLSARSGTTIGMAATTIYDKLPAHGRRVFREVNMGFPLSVDFGQAANASCELGKFARD